MAYTEVTLKKLFALSGNICAFPGCTAPIVDTEHGVVTGEICHIKARSPEGPRYDPEQTALARDGYDNLMLMCAISDYLNKDRYAAIPLDRMSLSMYIGSSKRVKELDQRMATANDIPLEKWDTRADALLDRYLEKTRHLGIATIADLDESLRKHGEAAVQLARYFRVQDRMHAGYCLDRMFDVRAAQDGQEALLTMYREAKLESGSETWAKEVWKAYEQVSKYA